MWEMGEILCVATVQFFALVLADRQKIEPGDVNVIVTWMFVCFDRCVLVTQCWIFLGFSVSAVHFRLVGNGSGSV